MVKLIKTISKSSGLPPGTLIHIGKENKDKVKTTVIDYDEKKFQEKEIEEIKECFPYKDKPTVTWINIDGVHQMDIIEKAGENFGLHSLTLEDIVNTGQRPKLEEFDDYIFIVIKMLSYNDNLKRIELEQVSLVLGDNYVLSFQEKEGDVFEGIRDRIRTSKGYIRKMKADYLAYALIDAVIDNYFTVLELIGDDIEILEEDLVKNPTMKSLQTIKSLKKNMFYIRKAVWPLREVVINLTRGDLKLIKKETIMYLRDVYDHTIQVIDTIESFRDMISSLLDIYMSSTSNKMNEVMKVLTIIATIFIPLTFIAGIYGMNFTFMPELNWKWGYFGIWGVMILVFLSMLFYFKRKKWL